MSLGGHLVSTGAALVLTAAHRHWLNSADREPSAPKTVQPLPCPRCKRVKGTCVVHQGFLPTSRERGWSSEAELSIPVSKLKGSGGGAGSRTVGDYIPAIAVAERYSPSTDLMDRYSKTFSSSHHPRNSHLLVGECLSLQLLPHLLPQPFGFCSIQ